jgi:hypothetical protein
LYLKHRPEKYKNIDVLLAMYKGQEHELLQQVKLKYCNANAP